jgi:hypothetical protein
MVMRYLRSFPSLAVVLFVAGSCFAQGVSITEHLRGISHTNLQGATNPAYGTGVLETWRWVDGREVIRIVIFQKPQQAPLIVSMPKFRTNVSFSAACESELMVVDGWGQIDMYSSDPGQRASLVRSTGVFEIDETDVTITKLQDGSMEFWLERVPGSTPTRGTNSISCGSTK